MKEQIYVVRGLRKALIGRPAITALQLLSCVNYQASSVKISKLFEGLGTMRERVQHYVKARCNTVCSINTSTNSLATKILKGGGHGEKNFFEFIDTPNDSLHCDTKYIFFKFFCERIGGEISL